MLESFFIDLGMRGHDQGEQGATRAPDDAQVDSLAKQQPQPQHQPHERALATLSEHLQFNRNQGLTWAPQHMDVCMRAALGSAAAVMALAVREQQEQQQQQHEQQEQQQQHEQQEQHHEQQQGSMIVALGAEEWTKAGGTGANSAQWVVQVGLIATDSSSTACAASATAAWQDCHALALEDAAPVALRGDLRAGLARGNWDAYGLELCRFDAPTSGNPTSGSGGSSTGNDKGGAASTAAAIGRLHALPGIAPLCVPLVVVSRTLFWQAGAADDGVEAAAAAGAPATTSYRRGPPRPPQLAPRTELRLLAKALARALGDLRARLPPGRLHSRAQARVAAALPPIAGALAGIVRNAVNPQLLHHACTLLACQPADVEGRLLASMAAAADAALAPAALPAAAAAPRDGDAGACTAPQQRRRRQRRASGSSEAKAAPATCDADGASRSGSEAAAAPAARPRRRRRAVEACEAEFGGEGVGAPPAAAAPGAISFSSGGSGGDTDLGGGKTDDGDAPLWGASSGGSAMGWRGGDTGVDAALLF